MSCWVSVDLLAVVPLRSSPGAEDADVLAEFLNDLLLIPNRLGVAVRERAVWALLGGQDREAPVT